MRVTRTAAAAFNVVFESEEELREEHRVNLAHGALRLPTTETVALHMTLLVTLRGPWGGEAFVRATAVAALPDGIALAIDGNPEEQLARLLVRSAERPTTRRSIRRTTRRKSTRTPGTGCEASRRWRRFCWR